LDEHERELTAVRALLERGGGVLIVEGRAGIGKTSLLEAACRQAQDLGYEVLRARGSEFEADFVFGVVRQLFERRVAATAAAMLWPDPRRAGKLRTIRAGLRHLSAEATAVFDATVLPRDFDTIEIPFPERGTPTLVRWKDQARPPEEAPADPISDPAR